MMLQPNTRQLYLFEEDVQYEWIEISDSSKNTILSSGIVEHR